MAPALEDALNTLLRQVQNNHADIVARLDAAGAELHRASAVDLLKPIRSHKGRSPVILRPSYLLDAKNEVVRFHARQRELANLHAWAESEAALGILLYAAPGGMGKTRLLQQLCHELNAAGWIAGFLGADIEDFKRREVRLLLTLPMPLLFVVDYPRERTGLVVKLLESLADVLQEQKIHRCRVVLLVRETGDWWDYLIHKSTLRELLNPERGIAEEPLHLSPLEPPTANDERMAVYGDAASEFARLLAQPDRSPPQIDLSGRTFDRVLLIHMAAYAAVCGHPQQEENALLNFVVEREKTRIQEMLQDANLDPREFNSAARQMVALITLIGGASKPEVDRLAGLLSKLCDLPASRRDVLLDRLHSLYPGAMDDDCYLAPIEPDLLGEHFVGSEGVGWEEALSVALGSSQAHVLQKSRAASRQTVSGTGGEEPGCLPAGSGYVPRRHGIGL